MFKKYLENKQFNFQINRFLGKFNDLQVQNDIESVLPTLTDTNTWYKVWRKLGEKSEAKGQFELASAYYQAGDFYLKESDLNKPYMYNKYRENFYKYYNELPIEHFQVPYENSFMPAMRIKYKDSCKTLIVHGGYDSYIEELIPVMSFLKDLGYDIILFEGPGQGGALRNGLKFIYNWEKPVSAILDYFDLKEVGILGASWGGYLCMRAAAFEKRIKEVICFDIFYCGMDAIGGSKKFSDTIEKLIANNERDKINSLILSNMKDNIDLNWKFCKGMDNTGTENPYDFIKAIQLHTMAGIEKFIDQDLLLLAGEEDQYVPIELMDLLENNLVNAKSITKKIFTKETGGEQHCQAGRMDLAFAEIKKFLTR
ncbi:alpha/beta fold hydrolase [Clostridium akagii]|uniref:alpha/beta fold hydrolase n=1 Tax=Clostridium akagii TaxID=91623 RepID=UPI00047A8554|nr:alpha/beta fold hydrolase [Clostridium akagii]